MPWREFEGDLKKGVVGLSEVSGMLAFFLSFVGRPELEGLLRVVGLDWMEEDEFLVGAGELSAEGRDVGFFLKALCLVPGFLSGPRRFGATSYSQASDRRTQLLHTGLVESQRILRPRLRNS
jgi:hypothetical protein